MNVLEMGNLLEDRVKGRVFCHEPMQKHTSWHIGGPADIMLMPANVDDINSAIAFAKQMNLPVTVLGNGSNVLVKDKGIRGIVIKLSRGFNAITVQGTTIFAEAGALLPVLAKKASNAGLTGVEFAAGIPASVGGAVYMNAGAHGKCIAEVIREVTVLGPDGQLKTLSNQQAEFCYRKSVFKSRGDIVVGALFQLEPGGISHIQAKSEENLAKRRRSQPLEYPNAGSVFANPPGNWAGYLIEQVGGKGMRVGDAMVSEKHANFIVNTGNATAADTLLLIDRIREMVREKFHIELSLEVRVLGE